MAQTLITQAQWREVAGWQKVEIDLDPDPSYFKGDQRPVEQVSWFEAMEFCHRLSRHTGRYYTLPSEAQWEYACRAGTTTPFHFGDTLAPEQANFSTEQTTDVASFPANAWGLHDMHGNVWEWCRDRWHNNYAGAPTDGGAWVNGDSLGGGRHPRKVLRGGSWHGVPIVCRSAWRNSGHPVNRSNVIGFRVCRRLEALELAAGLRHPTPDAPAAAPVGGVGGIRSADYRQ